MPSPKRPNDSVARKSMLMSFSPTPVRPANRTVLYPEMYVTYFQFSLLPRESTQTKTVVGDKGIRTPDLSHAKRSLYHLSYIPIINNAGKIITQRLFISREGQAASRLIEYMGGGAFSGPTGCARR